MTDTRTSVGAETTATSGVRTSSDGAAAAPASPVTSPERTVFYRYRDPSGREVIVDSLARVPSSARSTLETIAGTEPSSSIALPETIARDLHLPSFTAGGAAGLLVAALLFVLLRMKTLLMRVVLLGGLVLVGSGAYLGWIRRTTGHAGSLVESPAALIDDARSAVQKMNERVREQQRVLEELQSEP